MRLSPKLLAGVLGMDRDNSDGPLVVVVCFELPTFIGRLSNVDWGLVVVGDSLFPPENGESIADILVPKRSRSAGTKHRSFV